MKTRTILSRREFLKNASLASGLLILPSSVLGREGNTSPNSRINVACVGVGGMGEGDMNGTAAAGAEIVGLCDVDSGRLDRAGRKYGKAKKFKDYRELLDKLDKEIDAVTISTPDHTHFTVTMTAVMLRKHVYVQKPMAHTVDQCIRLAEAAKKYKVVTQMGNQGHSQTHIRVAKEWYEAGLLGEVKEIRAWTNRAASHWPQGFADYQPADAPRGKRDANPANLDWDLWLGPAREPASYRPGIAHFNWRGYYQYGNGALGDMAVHIIDPANYIFDLGAPTKIEVDLFGAKPSKISYPNRSKLTFYYPGTDKRGPIKIVWQDGPGSKPEKPAGFDQIEKLNDNGGSILYGDKETALLGSWGETFDIAGTQEHFNELRASAPKPKYERIRGSHYRNWVDSIKNGKQASSDFSYAAPFTANILLGAIAQRLGRNLEWDARTGRFKDDTEADSLLKVQSVRPGFLA